MTMNGAQSLMQTLVGSSVDTCFMNPGTSEMHFVAALDDVPEMRGVLALFEGVATGAADGFARMAGRPACTASAAISLVVAPRYPFSEISSREASRSFSLVSSERGIYSLQQM